MVISTGTHCGIAWASDSELGGEWVGTDGIAPARGHLQAGDTIVCQIEGIGRLSNPVTL